jgi:hypothetical protein
MKLQVYERNVYGRSTIYPTGEMAHHLRVLTGRKTLTTQDLCILNELGHEIDFVLDPDSAMARHAAHTLNR